MGGIHTVLVEGVREGYVPLLGVNSEELGSVCMCTLPLLGIIWNASSLHSVRSRETENFEYLKNVVFHYMCAEGASKEQMVTPISTILHFSPEEVMCVCLCTCAGVCVCVCACAHVLGYMCVCAYAHVLGYVCMCVPVHMCWGMCVYVPVHMCWGMCVYVPVHMICTVW